MAAFARHRPRPMATYPHIDQRSKYQYIRMKGMIRSALGVPPGGSGSMFSGMTPGGDNMTAGRGLALGMMGAPTSATNEHFPQSAGFGAPLSAGLDNGAASRRQSAIGNGGPRQILPGQLPGPGQQRKGSMASIGAS